MCHHRSTFVFRYPSDDINKFLWMVRIGGGVFPEIKEKDYLGSQGYTIDKHAGKVSYCVVVHSRVLYTHDKVCRSNMFLSTSMSALLC